MKWLWLTVLCLVGCGYKAQSPVKTEVTSNCPIQIASGSSTPVSWSCEQKEVNPSLVWIECNFTTEPTPFAWFNPCIKVTYFDEMTGKKVVSSRKICSGNLATGQKSTRYIAFTKKERKKLEKCGPMLESCVMLTVRANEQN